MHATRILKGVEGISVCELTAKDVVRHPLVMRIIRAYEKDDEARNEEKNTENRETGKRQKQIMPPKNRSNKREGE